MTSPYLSQRLRQNLYKKQYLEELGALLGRAVLQEELGSLEHVKTIREALQKLDGQPVTSCEIPFAERKTDRFKRFIQRLIEANPSPVYVWTEHSIDCGLLLVPSLSEIKFDFDFSINADGVFVFRTSDLCDRLLLDFSISHTNEQILQIETQGEHWLDVVY